MQIFAPTSDRQLNVSLTLLRVVTGAIFAAHGAQKLFVYGFDGVAGGFAQMGIPFAQFVGPSIGMLEFFGGLALVVGLFVRPIGLALAATALVAMFLVHLPAGFFMPNGYEFVLMLAGAAGALALTGAGAWSIDARLASQRLRLPASSRTLRTVA
jgi:putative oxidoreductase